jgi:hypothetical protein
LLYPWEEEISRDISGVAPEDKFGARFGARVTLLPPTEVLDAFLPATLTPMIEAFLAGLRPEDFAANLLLHFKGLARPSFYVEA